MEYAGQYKAYTYVSFILSASSAVFALFPFVYLWKIIKEVIEVISKLIKDKTVIIIAHRMRTVSGADKIVVIDKGKVAQEGNPAQLIKEDGI